MAMMLVIASGYKLGPSPNEYPHFWAHSSIISNWLYSHNVSPKKSPQRSLVKICPDWILQWWPFISTGYFTGMKYILFAWGDFLVVTTGISDHNCKTSLINRTFVCWFNRGKSWALMVKSLALSVESPENVSQKSKHAFEVMPRCPLPVTIWAIKPWIHWYSILYTLDHIGILMDSY